MVKATLTNYGNEDGRAQTCSVELVIVASEKMKAEAKSQAINCIKTISIFL